MNQANIDITIDGQQVSCAPGESIIAAADRHGIYIPRFCYHEKLSVVANCRMCLVEVQGVAKALPACATPVAKDMVVATQSQLARNAQKAVMQFLLINHPLDCPICDQGGECDLQDIAMGYGEGISKYTDRKRAVVDEDLGPLVATEMTRCIHCTRCVRFGDEIAGVPELVLTQRGGKSKISTYLQAGVESELSGNMIDVCPVGALTSKPYRFHGRSWGYEQHNGLAAHDCVGSNTYIHVDKTNSDGQARIMRVVPKTNAAVNDQWLSDIDRFSYQAVNSANRLLNPMVKKDGRWQEVSWYDALEFAADGLRKVIIEHGANNVGVLGSPQVSLEEAYLMQLVMRSEGICNIDHRYRMQDFAYDDYEQLYPSLNLTLEELQERDNIVIFGGDIRRQQPMLNHRIRQAHLSGAKTALVHAYDPEYNFRFDTKIIRAPSEWLTLILELLSLTDVNKLSKSTQTVIKGINASSEAKELYDTMHSSDAGVIVLGLQAVNHGSYSVIRAYLEELALAVNHVLAIVTEGANSSGMWLAGIVPHRGAFAQKLAKVGDANICSFNKAAKAYWLHQVEPIDIYNYSKAKTYLQKAEFVVACTSFNSPELSNNADVLLPLALPAETSGIWVNAEGRWQFSQAAVLPLGQAKPGWKIYRALAQCLDHSEINFDNLEQIRQAITSQNEEVDLKPAKGFTNNKTIKVDEIEVLNYWPANQQDSMVRHAQALQDLPESHAIVHPDTFEQHAKAGKIKGYKCHTSTKVAKSTLVLPRYYTGDK